MGESPVWDSYGSDTPSLSAQSRSAPPSTPTLPTREVVKSSTYPHANGCTPSTATSSRPLSPVSSQTPPSFLRNLESAPLPPAHVSALKQTMEPSAAQLDSVPPLTSPSAPAPIRHVPRVPLPHLATPPLAIFRWHARMASAPPPPMVPTVAAIAALVAEQRTAELFASTTPMSPAPTIVDILKEAGRRARSRGATQVTPLDVRHAAQLFAPPRASLVPPKPFVDPGTAREIISIN